MSRPLYVASPLLPDLDLFLPLIQSIWQSKTVTNGGPLHNELERELSKYLNVPTAMVFNNGTIALLVALKMFDLPAGSEIITTPFTFAATAHAITWNGYKPVFVDVIPHTLTIDPAAVELAITKKTAAILAVHVYGNVCDVDALQTLAAKYNLRLIYDSAHVFGTTIYDRAIGTFGDASVFSFHATKLFNTIEGGLIATPREVDRDKIYHLRNFGIKNEEEVVSVGINGKMNELQAAVGLLNLPKVRQEQEARRSLRERYNERLNSLQGVLIPPRQVGVVHSEQYYPVIIDQNRLGSSRDQIYDRLKAKQIFCRKYFHPICTDFVPYQAYEVVSTRPVPYVYTVKNQVLCLPYHSNVDEEDVDEICNEFLR